MQFLLRRSEFRQDIRCSIFGQGFRLYRELSSPSERATMRSVVPNELRVPHSREQCGDKTTSAHPFNYRPGYVLAARSKGVRAAACSPRSLLLGLGVLMSLPALAGCGAGVAIDPNLLTISPSKTNLQQGGGQQFVVSKTGTVLWSLGAGSTADGAILLGSISATGYYTAPAGPSTATVVKVIATTAGDPKVTSSAVVTIAPCIVQVTPAKVTVAAGATQLFTASTCGGAVNPSRQWTVNGTAGGSSIYGTISADGIYTAPAIDPGKVVTIAAIDSSNGSISSTASVSVANPALPAFAGATYAKTLQGWNASLLPWIEDLSGLSWNADTRTWSPTPEWMMPAEGIAPEIYYLEEALRPATRMAIVKQDIALMEELAMFHVALLEWRTATIGSMLGNAPPNSVIFIDGGVNARTFAWYEPLSSTQVRIRDCQTCNAQYLSTAARLLRAIAEMPAASRTAPLTNFAQRFSSFLVSDQLLRLLYGTTPWSHWDNPNIPQPVVSAWTFLAQSGYLPPQPIKYQAEMTYMELWFVADSAEVLAADNAAPELNILNSDSRAKLHQAVMAGDALIQARCHHAVSPDGADVLSAFAGDYDDHPDYAYSAITTPEQPSAPAAKEGVGWDSSHSYRLPVIFRTLYETRGTTGISFPALSDVVALGNSYVHLAFNGNSELPAFNNFIDGWNGWFQVETPSIISGYPPYQGCQATQNPDNCLTPGTLQGWGELATVNPDLAALSQRLVNLAYDDSPATVSFKDQHYFYAGQHYSANSGTYPLLMVYVAGDSAERLP